MVDGFHLLRPELLWGLLIFPLLVVALWHRRTRQGDWGRAIDPELLPYLMPEDSDKTRQTSIWMPALLLSLIVLAAAGPACDRWNYPLSSAQTRWYWYWISARRCWPQTFSPVEYDALDKRYSICWI